MVKKEDIRLNQTVWIGEEKQEGTVDMLTQSFAVIEVPGVGGVIAKYDDIFCGEQG